MIYTPKEHLIVMLWILLGSAVVMVGIYLIGHAVHDANDQGHKQELECISVGGHLERAPGTNSGLICQK